MASSEKRKKSKKHKKHKKSAKNYKFEKLRKPKKLEKKNTQDNEQVKNDILIKLAQAQTSAILPTLAYNVRDIADNVKKTPTITTDPTKLVEIITKSLNPSNGPSMEIVSSESDSQRYF